MGGQQDKVGGQKNKVGGQKNKVGSQKNKGGVKKTRWGVKKTRCPTRQLTNHVQPKPNWVNGPRNIQFNDVFHVQSHDHPLDFWVKAISSGFGFDGFPGKELL